MSTTTDSLQQILLILFPGFNTLDMNGPYEVLQKCRDGNAFKITVASETEITTSIEGVQVKRDVALDDALIGGLKNYDILVVPGGTSPPVIAQVAKMDSPFMRLIGAYAVTPPPRHGTRILLSICTGAIFLGALGIFNDRLCTTHWGAYKLLIQHVQEAAVRTHCQKPGTVVASRFVDSGLNKEGVRIISSGGISCGMDASLYVVKLKFDENEAQTVAALLDYAWRKTEGFVVLPQTATPLSSPGKTS